MVRAHIVQVAQPNNATPDEAAALLLDRCEQQIHDVWLQDQVVVEE